MNLHTTYLSLLAIVLGVEYRLGKKENGCCSIVEVLLTVTILAVAEIILYVRGKKNE